MKFYSRGKVAPNLQETGKAPEVSAQTSETKLLEIINNIPGSSDCEFEEVKEGMKNDADDHGFQILTDKEIVDSIQEEDKREGEEDKRENDEQTPSSTVFEIAIKPSEKQNECNAAQLLTLQRLWDLSSRKLISYAKQTSLLDFLE
jgi:hypothetical protein